MQKTLVILSIIMLFILTVDLKPPLVQLNKSVYAIGEKVIITIVNPNNEPIMFPSPDPYEIVSVPGREVIYKPKSPQVLYELSGRGHLIKVWDQTDNTGNQVPPGKYIVVVKWVGGEVYSEVFEIRAQRDNVAYIKALMLWIILLTIIVIILFVLIYFAKTRRSF